LISKHDAHEGHQQEDCGTTGKTCVL
jgi:hypothetical protein